MLNPIPIIGLGALILAALFVSAWLWIAFAAAFVLVAIINS